MLRASQEKAHVILQPSVEASVVHWVRNYALAKLYESTQNFDYVLFMDDDMSPPPEALNVLLDRKVDIIGAICTVREDPPLPNALKYIEKGFTFQKGDIDRAGIWKVGAIGTGFMLISRKALEIVGEYTLKHTYQQRYQGMPQEMAFEKEAVLRERAKADHNQWWFEFLKHPLGETEWGEDVSFCFKARECGLEIYGDSTTIVGHIGRYPYSLRDYWDYREDMVREGKVVPLSEGSEVIPRHEEYAIEVFG